MKKLPGSDKGFTLIELMLIVGIIGLLTAIALPAFMNYQARSKQSEAKVNLAGIFSAETAYFAEKSRYNPALRDVGFSLAGQGKYYDFTVEAPNAGGSWPSGAWVGVNGTPGEGPAAAEATLNFVDNIKPGVSQLAFTALAAGNIDGDSTYDTWTMTSERVLKQQWDDLTN